MTLNQCVCAHICCEFNVPHPRIPQNHEKAVQLLPLPVLVHQVILEESPVHLLLLSWHRLKPHRCFPIQVHLPAADIRLDDAVAPVKSHLPQLLQYPQRRIRRILQPLLHNLFVRIYFCWLGFA